MSDQHTEGGTGANQKIKIGSSQSAEGTRKESESSQSEGRTFSADQNQRKGRRCRSALPVGVAVESARTVSLLEQTPREV